MPGAPNDVLVVSSGSINIHTLPSSNAAGTSDIVALPMQGVTGGVPLPVAINSGGGGPITAASGALADGSIVTIGTQSDAAWSGSGNSTLVAALKAIYAKVAGIIGVSQSGTWTVQPGNTANTTAWKVDGSAVTQPVSAASLPLPAGASQDGTDGTGITPPTGAVGIRGWLSGIFNKLNTSIAVTGTFWQSTQPVSGTITANAGTNLNTSALALDSNQTAPYTPVAAATATATKAILLGGHYNGTTVPSFTAGQEGYIPVDQNGALNCGFDGQQVSPASVTSAANIFTQDMTGYAGITVHITSAGTGCTITYETSEDNVTFIGTTGCSSGFSTGSTWSSATTTTAVATFPKRGRYFRARVSTYGSGTVTVIYSLNKSTPVFSGNVGVQGTAASGATIGVNPVAVGFDARTSNLAVTNGQAVYGVSTMAGAQIVYPWSIPELTWQFAAASGGIVNTTTAVTLQSAGAAGIRNYLTRLQLSCNSGTFTATEIAIRDGAAGTVIWRGNIPSSTSAVPMAMQTLNFEPPLRGSAATLMEFVTLTATGASTAVYVNAQGFQGP